MMRRFEVKIRVSTNSTTSHQKQQTSQAAAHPLPLNVGLDDPQHSDAVGEDQD